MYPMVVLFNFGINASHQKQNEFHSKLSEWNMEQSSYPVGGKTNCCYLFLSTKTPEEVKESLKSCFDEGFLDILVVAALDPLNIYPYGDQAIIDLIKCITSKLNDKVI